MEEVHVVTCFLEHEGKIPILRRSELVGTYRGKWAALSGYIEKGKAPLEQALQEIREEVGLGEGDVELVKEGEPLDAIDEELDRKWVVYPFRFQVIMLQKINIDWEHTELEWIDPGEIAQYETVPRLAETWQRVA